ncbi:hypothetical protein GCM10010191_24550 [Actinomadura vinacea]|uniref:Histidine kinase/HSP90-like ATPase domain-containing protein n=1 Tax=Actinomadura vinacea TaxID=115336 RepID=A0ABN3IVY7_9ACTN
MISDRPSDIPLGGACLWALPLDASIAARARYLVTDALGILGFPAEQIDNGRLAVSEVATNALQHTRTRAALPELWMWARTYPSRELVVTVFDASRERVPAEKAGGPLDEHGRGLGMVASVCVSWGSGPSRSLLNEQALPGKAVWFTLPLPGPWPGTARLASPTHTAASLRGLLARRGVHGVITSHTKGMAMVSVPCGINVTVEMTALRHPDANGTWVRRPLTDMTDLAEHIVSRTEALEIRPLR